MAALPRDIFRGVDCQLTFNTLLENHRAGTYVAFLPFLSFAGAFMIGDDGFILTFIAVKELPVFSGR